MLSCKVRVPDSASMAFNVLGPLPVSADAHDNRTINKANPRVAAIPRQTSCKLAERVAELLTSGIVLGLRGR